MAFSKSVPIADVSVIPLQFENLFCHCYFFMKRNGKSRSVWLRNIFRLYNFAAYFRCYGFRIDLYMPRGMYFCDNRLCTTCCSKFFNYFVFPSSPDVDHFIIVFLPFIFWIVKSILENVNIALYWIVVSYFKCHILTTLMVLNTSPCVSWNKYISHLWILLSFDLYVHFGGNGEIADVGTSCLCRLSFLVRVWILHYQVIQNIVQFSGS